MIEILKNEQFSKSLYKKAIKINKKAAIGDKNYYIKMYYAKKKKIKH